MPSSGLWVLGSYVLHRNTCRQIHIKINNNLISFFSFLIFGFLLLFACLLSFAFESHCVALVVLDLCVDQVGLKLRNLPASASPVQELKACTIMPR